jgi:hypothetical protein
MLYVRKAGGEQPSDLSPDAMFHPCGGVCGSVDIYSSAQLMGRKAGAH